MSVSLVRQRDPQSDQQEEGETENDEGAHHVHQHQGILLEVLTQEDWNDERGGAAHKGVHGRDHVAESEVSLGERVYGRHHRGEAVTCVAWNHTC